MLTMITGVISLQLWAELVATELENDEVLRWVIHLCRYDTIRILSSCCGQNYQVCCCKRWRLVVSCYGLLFPCTQVLNYARLVDLYICIFTIVVHEYCFLNTQAQGLLTSWFHLSYLPCCQTLVAYFHMAHALVRLFWMLGFYKVSIGRPPHSALCSSTLCGSPRLMQRICTRTAAGLGRGGWVGGWWGGCF